MSEHRHDRGGPAPRRREGHLGRDPAPGAGRRPGLGLQAPSRRRRRGRGRRSTPTPMDIRIIAYDIDEEGNWVNPRDDTPSDLGRIAAQTFRAGDEPAHPRGRARAQVRGVRQPRGRHRHRHHPAERQPLHAARPGQGRGAAAPGRAGALRAARAQRPPQGLHRRGAAHLQGPPDRGVSRTHPGLIKRLFELEVPEIADGVVEIKACAREPGHRTKIAVWSNDHNVDPVGACVGARGARVRMVVTELRGEKIDIVPFSEDSADFVAKALSPAKVKEVRIHEDTGMRRGHRARLPAVAGHREGGPERPPGRPAHRLAGRHQERDPAGRRGGRHLRRVEDDVEYAEGEWVANPTPARWSGTRPRVRSSPPRSGPAAATSRRRVGDASRQRSTSRGGGRAKRSSRSRPSKRRSRRPWPRSRGRGAARRGASRSGRGARRRGRRRT